MDAPFIGDAPCVPHWAHRHGPVTSELGGGDLRRRRRELYPREADARHCADGRSVVPRSGLWSDRAARSRYSSAAAKGKRPTVSRTCLAGNDTGGSTDRTRKSSMAGGNSLKRTRCSEAEESLVQPRNHSSAIVRTIWPRASTISTDQLSQSSRSAVPGHRSLTFSMTAADITTSRSQLHADAIGDPLMSLDQMEKETCRHREWRSREWLRAIEMMSGIRRNGLRWNPV